MNVFQFFCKVAEWRLLKFETPQLNQQPTSEAKIFHFSVARTCDRRTFDAQLRYLILTGPFGPAHLDISVLSANPSVCIPQCICEKGLLFATPSLPLFRISGGTLWMWFTIQRLSLSHTGVHSF